MLYVNKNYLSGTLHDWHKQSSIISVGEGTMNRQDSAKDACRVSFTILLRLPFVLDASADSCVHFSQALQEEFVTARKDDPSAMSVNDFHRLLSLVR